MSKVVKITVDDDGEKVDNPKWCYVFVVAGGETRLCTGEFFGSGESRAVFATKQGRITCNDCITIIKEFKNIKL